MKQNTIEVTLTLLFTVKVIRIDSSSPKYSTLEQNLKHILVSCLSFTLQIHLAKDEN